MEIVGKFRNRISTYAKDYFQLAVRIQIGKKTDGKCSKKDFCLILKVIHSIHMFIVYMLTY